MCLQNQNTETKINKKEITDKFHIKFIGDLLHCFDKFDSYGSVDDYNYMEIYNSMEIMFNNNNNTLIENIVISREHSLYDYLDNIKYRTHDPNIVEELYGDKNHLKTCQTKYRSEYGEELCLCKITFDNLNKTKMQLITKDNGIFNQDDIKNAFNNIRVTRNIRNRKYELFTNYQITIKKNTCYISCSFDLGS